MTTFAEAVLVRVEELLKDRRNHSRFPLKARDVGKKYTVLTAIETAAQEMCACRGGPMPADIEAATEYEVYDALKAAARARYKMHIFFAEIIFGHRAVIRIIEDAKPRLCLTIAFEHSEAVAVESARS